MNCPNCSAEMTAMTLDGHQGRPVGIDLCVTCQAFWFDKYESLQLAPASTLRLLKIIGERSSPGPAQFADPRCPRCSEPLRPTQDMQRTTKFSYFRCVSDHGRFIRFFEFLREKDFIRPLSKQQLDEVRHEMKIINCSSCGAPIDLAAVSACGHCKSPVSMLDMKQPEALLAQLREASVPRPVDPSLPLELVRAKRDVNALFGDEPKDLVQVCLNSVSRWLKGSGFLLIAGILLFALPLAAHHAVSAKFDLTKRRTLNGIVTKVDWSNPHVHVLMNVGQGERSVNWAVEMESQLELEQSKWNRDSVKPGDALTVQGPVARDGTPQIWGESVTRTRTGQRVLNMTPEGLAYFRPMPATQPARPAPRWPDGKPRLGPAPGEAGYWGRPSSRVLKENGVTVEIADDGLLKNVNDAAKVAPFQPWARDLYTHRQRQFLKDDPMFLECYPPGALRQFQLPYGIQFIEDKAFERIFVMNGGGNHDWHYIYTDGRAQQGNVRGNADNPLYYGYAVGRWEGDTLVVDSKGFNEKFWFSTGGLPHTQQLKLVERFTRTDRNTLKYEVTIDDPGAYTRPWSASWTLQWISDEELPVYYCQDNRA